MAYAFTGEEDRFQLWSSLFATGFSAYGFFALFYWYPLKKNIAYQEYVAWAGLFLVTLLEVVFLVSLIVNGNNYELVRTNYSTIRIAYHHSAKQIVLLFAMGIVAIVTLLVEAVAAQRLELAIQGNNPFHVKIHRLHKHWQTAAHIQLLPHPTEALARREPGCQQGVIDILP